MEKDILLELIDKRLRNMYEAYGLLIYIRALYKNYKKTTGKTEMEFDRLKLKTTNGIEEIVIKENEKLYSRLQLASEIAEKEVAGTLYQNPQKLGSWIYTEQVKFAYAQQPPQIKGIKKQAAPLKNEPIKPVLYGVGEK